MSWPRFVHVLLFFFFNDTAPTEIYTLPLHDALPIFATTAAETCQGQGQRVSVTVVGRNGEVIVQLRGDNASPHTAENSRSEEHTSELQSQSNLVCRLLLEKKKITTTRHRHTLSITSR